jgi:hypothetical protein
MIVGTKKDKSQSRFNQTEYLHNNENSIILLIRQIGSNNSISNLTSDGGIHTGFTMKNFHLIEI